MVAFFSKLEEMIMLVVQMLESDQTLCKLLYYGEPNPLSQPDIPDTTVLLMNSIFPLPKSPDAEQNQKAFVNVYFYSSSPYNKNSGFREVYLCFDVICHLDVWMIDGGMRPYHISSRIDKMFNNSLVAELSINPMYFSSWKHMRYSDYFYGYHITYKLSNNSNVGCDDDG